jgi:hypothetical protein
MATAMEKKQKTKMEMGQAKSDLLSVDLIKRYFEQHEKVGEVHSCVFHLLAEW